MSLICPVCKVVNPSPPACRRCKADLSLLFQLEQQRQESQAQARKCLQAGDASLARKHARAMNHLRQDNESLRLLAVTSLMCGDFPEAWRIYQALQEKPTESRRT